MSRPRFFSSRPLTQLLDMSRLVVVLLMLPLAVTAGTCLDGTTSMIAGSNLVVEIVGPKATIYPPLSSGQPDRNAFSLGLDMTMITERRRGGLNGDPNQPTNDICFAPMNSFSDPSVTPLSDHWHGTQCGDLVKYVNLTEFDCSTREFTAYPLPGVQVKSVELTMAHESSPFTFVALFELPNANATKATYSNTTYSNGTVYSTHYRYAPSPSRPVAARQILPPPTTFPPLAGCLCLPLRGLTF